jgi:pentatricopeptide repeat protein
MSNSGSQDTLATLRSMGMAGVVPSADTFNTLMSACLARGDAAAVLSLFRRMISLGHDPDALSYTSLIASLLRLGRPHDAVRSPLSGCVYLLPLHWGPHAVPL